jgi:uncharacterized protein (DUF58 family)
MYRLTYKLFWLSSGSQHWTRRKFTPAGQFVMVCMTMAALLGIDTDLTLAYQVFTLSLTLLVVAYLASSFFRGRFEAERSLPPFVTAGEPFSYKARVTNKGRKSLHGLEVVELLSDPRPTFEAFCNRAPPWWRGLYPHWRMLLSRRQAGEVKAQSLARLPLQDSVDLTMEGLAHRRGYMEFSALTIARRDALGLCRALIDVPGPQVLLVLPKRYNMPEIQLPGTRSYQHGGVTMAASKGDSEEFVGLRDYRPGDPMKIIHWKSFARIGKPVVKEYQDEYFERHALVLDTFVQAEHEAVFEEAVSLAASFVCTLETQENLLDLMFVGKRAYTFTAGLGQLHTESMLEVLAGVQYCADDQLADLRLAILERRASLSGCILILLAWDQRRRDLVQELATLGLPLKVYVVVADQPLEIEAPTAEVQVLKAGKIQQGLVSGNP